MAARVVTPSNRLSERGHKASENPYSRAKGVEAIGTAASCIAIGVVLPFFIHMIGVSPRVLLPMHFSLFLAGVLLNPVHAAIVGVFAPAISMGLTGMPTPEQTIRMIPELATYGVVTSLMLSLLPTLPLASERVGRILAIGVAMLVAMICGRMVYVLFHAWLTGLEVASYYWGVLVVPAIPGLVAQIVIIPPLAYQVQRVMKQ
jgi:niacin transporter